MAYWGYYEFMIEYMEQVEAPNVLEIGVDKGQTLIPVLCWLVKNREQFGLVGVDIMRRDSVQVILEQITRFLNDDKQELLFLEMSSFDALKILKDHNEEKDMEGMFHMILLDGDHNYYTVKRELESLPGLLKKGGFILIDDYSGAGSNENEYFSEFPGYENNKHATLREGTEDPEKKGLNLAVDEFLQENPDWILTDAVRPGYEPRILFRKGELHLVDSRTEEELVFEDQKEVENG